MRKIESEMNQAIHNKQNWSKDNTRVEYQCELNTPVQARIENARVYLHNNHIGTFVYPQINQQGLQIGGFYVNNTTLLNWPTPTTKSRLRALGVSVSTKKGVIYINGKEVTA